MPCKRGSVHRKYRRKSMREKGIEQEMKEHPWAGRKIATRIEMDHEHTKSGKIKKPTGCRKPKMDSGAIAEARSKYVSGGK